MSPSTTTLDAQSGESLAQAIAALSDGGLVIFPTETFYGIAARIDRPEALEKLASVKQRQPGEVLPTIAASLPVVRRWATIEAPLDGLVEALWPGPLTLALRPRRPAPAEVSSVDGTVGVRVSSHALAIALATESGGLITATSANLRDRPPPTKVADLEPQLLEHIALVLDDGVLAGGEPSTVVGLRQQRAIVLRQGAVTNATLATVLGYDPEAAAPSGRVTGAASPRE